MLLHDHFDVANLLGHPAFDHLAKAMSVYDQARQSNLLNPELHSWPKCLGSGGQLSTLRHTELTVCVQTVILFQAMMEKLPYFIPTIDSDLKVSAKSRFAGTWNSLLSQIKDTATQTAALAAFDEYKTNFYEAFRNPIIHGRTDEDINKVNKIRVPGVYEGMRQGWCAYDYLLTEAFAPQQTHEPSWVAMCESHGILGSLDSAIYPDLEDLESQFRKKHIDGARAVVGSEE